MEYSKAYSADKKEDEKCYRLLANIKWPDKSFQCKKCGYDKYYVGKKPYSRRCMKHSCKYDESPTANTSLENIHLPLSDIFDFIYGMCLLPFNNSSIIRPPTEGLLSPIKPIKPNLAWLPEVMIEEVKNNSKPRRISRSKTLFDLRRRIQRVMGSVKHELYGDIEICITTLKRLAPIYKGKGWAIFAVELEPDEYYFESTIQAEQSSRSKNIRKCAVEICEEINEDILRRYVKMNISVGCNVEVYGFPEKAKYANDNLHIVTFKSDDELGTRVGDLLHNLHWWLNNLNYRINRESIELETNEFVFRSNVYSLNYLHRNDDEIRTIVQSELIRHLTREKI